MSLDCLFFIASSVFSNVYLLVYSVSCVPNVVSVSGLSFFYCIFGILAAIKKDNPETLTTFGTQDTEQTSK